MVTRPFVALALVLAAVTAGCGPAGVPVEIDLCAPEGLTPSERTAMGNAETWQVVVFGLRDDDVVFERIFEAGGDGADLLVGASAAVPPSQEVRLLVRGYEPTPSGQYRTVAMASSSPLQLVGGERVCMCVAPPEIYGVVCYQEFCTYTADGGCSFAMR